MLLKKIKLKNIRSYENAEIRFKDGSTLLSGDIGSGKTSILLAIQFALFGLQPGQRGSSLLKNGKNYAYVGLEFEIDGQRINVERTLKKGKTISQDYASITIDGEKKEMSITEIKSFILNILDYPREFVKKINLLYKFTVYTPQEEMKQIILENSETRLNTLRHVFGIDKYKKIKENAVFLASKLREEARNKEGVIQNLDEKKEKLIEKNKTVEELKSRNINVEIRLEKARIERKKIEEKILEIESKKKEKENFEKEVEKTKVMLIGKKEMITNLNREIGQLEQQIKETREVEEAEKFDELEFQQKFQQIENNIKEKKQQADNIKKEIIEIISKINSIVSINKEAEDTKNRISSISKCPTCLQQVEEVYKKNIFSKYEEEIKKNENLLKELIEKKKKAGEKTEIFEGEISELEKQKSKLNILKVKLEVIKEKIKRKEELEKQKISVEKDIQLLTGQIETLKQSAAELSKFENIFLVKKKELDEALIVEKMQEIKIAQIKKEIELEEKEIFELEKEIKEKEEIKNKLNYILELEDWLSNKFLSLISFTERNVMLKLREEFSKLFNEWFSILVEGDIIVRLDEDFTPIIEQQGYDTNYTYLSGGERTAVALAYRLALNQVINSILGKIKTRDLVILDEPTDGFSDQQLDKMRDVLQELNIRQLILVSHEQKIESFVENIIKFKKKDGVTVVKEES